MPPPVRHGGSALLSKGVLLTHRFSHSKLPTRIIKISESAQISALQYP